MGFTSVSVRVIYYLWELIFMNDATWNYKNLYIYILKNENNSEMQGFTVRAKYSIESGVYIKMTYDGE